jgi:hypothetical protein
MIWWQRIEVMMWWQRVVAASYSNEAIKSVQNAIKASAAANRRERIPMNRWQGVSMDRWKSIFSTMIWRQAVVSVLKAIQAVHDVPDTILHVDQTIKINLAVPECGIEPTTVHSVPVLLSITIPSQNDHRQEYKQK